jgi:hypothetical protein
MYQSQADGPRTICRICTAYNNFYLIQGVNRTTGCESQLVTLLHEACMPHWGRDALPVQIRFPSDGGPTVPPPTWSGHHSSGRKRQQPRRYITVISILIDAVACPCRRVYRWNSGDCDIPFRGAAQTGR